MLSLLLVLLMCVACLFAWWCCCCVRNLTPYCSPKQRTKSAQINTTYVLVLSVSYGVMVFQWKHVVNFCLLLNYFHITSNIHRFTIKWTWHNHTIIIKTDKPFSIWICLLLFTQQLILFFWHSNNIKKTTCLVLQTEISIYFFFFGCDFTSCCAPLNAWPKRERAGQI